MIWVYALTDRPTAVLPDVTGHDSGRLEQTCTSEFAGVWSNWSCQQNPRPTADDLWCQEAVVEALMTDRTVLPMRFATVLADADELATAMTSRSDSLRTALDRVRGCVEMGVRARFEPSTSSSGCGRLSGTDYLLGRAAERGRADAIAATVHQRLAAASTGADKAVRRGIMPVLVGAYLVPEPQLDRFRTTVRELAADNPDLSIACTGPWPPYSFAEPGGLEP